MIRPLVTAALLLAAARPATAQAIHRATSPAGRVTETVTFTDAWEDGGSGPHADGILDVLTKLEVTDEPARRESSHLLLFGPWGSYLYAWNDELAVPGNPDTTSERTAMRAVDLDGDGPKELLFIERRLTTRLAMDETGMPLEQPGPFFQDAAVSLRYLTRENGSLVEHDLEAEAASPAMKELLQRELGGALNAWLQLAAADTDFVKERYEMARYRYGVVREWAESQLTGAEIAKLGPDLALVAASPDDPPVLWLAATRRIGALPRWYQKR